MFETAPGLPGRPADEQAIARVRFQALVKTRTPVIEILNVKRTDAHIREMLDIFCSVLKAIEAGIFFR